MLKEGSGRILSDLVEIRSGIQPEKIDIDSGGEIPFIRIENLARDILDTELGKDFFNKVHNIERYQRSIIQEKCILIARIGDNLKATIFNPKDGFEKILIHTGVYALIPSQVNTEIDVEYLYYQLYTSFVVEQVQKKKLGAVMPYISIAGLKQIVVPYVDKPSQRSFIESQKANLITEERNRVEEKIRALGYKEDVKQSESDIIKTLTHQLRPTFLGINNLTNRIERIINKEHLNEIKEYNNVELEKLIDPEIAEFTKIPDNYSLHELLEKLSNDSKHLSDILSNVDKVMNFKLSSADLREVDILEFINSYSSKKKLKLVKIIL